MSLIAYVQDTAAKVTIPPAGTYLLEIVQQRQPFEDVSLWVEMNSAVGTYSAQATLNEIPVGSPVTGVTTQVPQLIQLPGIFPSNAPTQGGQGTTVPGSGVIPGLLVTNTGAAPIVVTLNALARSMGAAGK